MAAKGVMGMSYVPPQGCKPGPVSLVSSTSREAEMPSGANGVSGPLLSAMGNPELDSPLAVSIPEPSPDRGLIATGPRLRVHCPCAHDVPAAAASPPITEGPATWDMNHSYCRSACMLSHESLMCCTPGGLGRLVLVVVSAATT